MKQTARPPRGRATGSPTQCDGVPRRRPGRPRAFDREAALHAAMLRFWRHGYEATSLRDLTEAMGVTAPSLYAAFGDKKALFRAAVRRYAGEPATADLLVDTAPTARAAAEALLEAAVEGFTGADTPPGCLLASAAISCSAEAADVQREVAAIRGQTEARLRDRIVRAFAEGELEAVGDADAEADALAGHVLAVIQGLSTLARDGAPRDKLRRVATAAMRAWPERRAGARGRRSARTSERAVKPVHR